MLIGVAAENQGSSVLFRYAIPEGTRKYSVVRVSGPWSLGIHLNSIDASFKALVSS
jgi:hypothetical protein